MDELAKLQLVAEHEVILIQWEADVDRMGGVGYFDIESVLRPEIFLIEVDWDDVGHLQQSISVLPGRLGGSGFHAIEKL